MKKKETVSGLKIKIKQLETELQKVKEDRVLFRNFLVNEMRVQLTNMTQQTYTPGEAMIKRITQALNKAEYFYLGL